MYRTSNWLNDVVYGIAHTLGIDPEFDVLKDHARAWASAANTRLRYAWEFWPWAELQLTEERAFRQIWYTDVEYKSNQEEQSEVYYLPSEKYYRIKPDAVAAVPIGSTPTGTALGIVNVNLASNEFSTAAGPHGLVLNGTVRFEADTTLPAPLVADTDYYVRAIGSPTTFTIATSIGGSELDITTNPAGQDYVFNTSYWEEIPEAEFDRFIAFEQHGKQSIGQIVGVFGQNPRLGVPVAQWVTRPSGKGIDVSIYAGNTVWIIFKPRQPVFTTRTYDPQATYVRGDCVLDLDSGDCSLALRQSQGAPLTGTADWLIQEFPYIFTEHIVSAVAADMADDVIMQRQLNEAAEELLYREVDKNTEHGERFYVGPSNRCRRLPLGTSGYYRTLYPFVT